ncbi:MAG: antibiotic biosynthesis monooxygenase [Actinomycetota bacterium]|nr:antibiotic biosynthesis monooxygenase [Actinomycetota bacterium]
MATLIAHIRVVEGQESRFESIARALFRTTHDTEPAVRRYEYWRAAQPREYYALIACDDFRGFITHQTSDHHESAAPDLGQVIESLRLEWVDPVAGASDLPPTEMQQAVPDADDLTRTYTERFAAQIAPWWLALR